MSMSVFDTPIKGIFEGEVELTRGSFGHQFMTIGGVRYATWQNCSNWPSPGDCVEHKPFRDHGMLCTKIVKVASGADRTSIRISPGARHPDLSERS